MAPSIDRLSLRLDAVRTTLVSDIVQDPVSGLYVRVVQFYTDAPDTLNPRPVIEITLTGAAMLDVELQTPKLNF